LLNFRAADDPLAVWTWLRDSADLRLNFVYDKIEDRPCQPGAVCSQVSDVNKIGLDVQVFGDVQVGRTISVCEDALQTEPAYLTRVLAGGVRCAFISCVYMCS
jgi:hypothetical protein